MNWNKVLSKGIEGAIVAGVSAGAGTQAMNVEDQQQVLATALAIILGFLLRAGRNWLKHRKDSVAPDAKPDV